jgi:hypothetical protein
VLKTWKDWFILITLGLVTAGGIGFVVNTALIQNEENQVNESPAPVAQSEESEDFSSDTMSPKSLIVGKWRYTGSVKYGPSSLDSTVEYFEDGTYSSRLVTPVLPPNIENGDYVILSDGRIKRSYEYCSQNVCKKKTDVGLINFPDQDTLHVETDDNTAIFARIAP